MNKEKNFIEHININELKKKNKIEFFIARSQNQIIKLLKFENSLSSILEKLKQEKECPKMSISTLSKYLKIFFAKSFYDFLDRKTFEKYKFIAFVTIFNEKLEISEAYKKMLREGKLRHATKSKTFCSEKYFVENIKKYIEISIKK
ncbi:hypothetical protein [Halarcobacter bivalviorum]|uniref:hypothetical protein n=1 Tax=Halarcobacter bivalviorum TaxID=663364 RepID=UPI00100B528E|nr:hypothetical protein [Halarcobacter bivalviorum]RXK06976.1 hypothetical protein CRU97_02390 [Halarcobacter bivalviorum]